MYLFDLREKLRRCNPKLYLHQTDYTCAVRLATRAIMEHLKTTNLSLKLYKAAEDYNQGHMDEFIAGMPTDYIPEYTEFNAEGEIERRGWHNLAVILARKNLVSWERVRKVFGSSSIGESDYDRSH